ncbi:hypothetical protein T05_588 [Trichinella murrelli]|uniref:Uncharacterized protein n=1 Tax=Trichinella murrelli TaxID=144512 RepID=A0A0V0UH95_9BILA|nr:hypothetical protein T05_588 [Trichinella murrelli]
MSPEETIFLAKHQNLVQPYKAMKSSSCFVSKPNKSEKNLCKLIITNKLKQMPMNLHTYAKRLYDPLYHSSETCVNSSYSKKIK